MNNDRRIHVAMMPGKKFLLAVSLVAALTGCVKTHFHENDLKDFKTVVLVANKSSYSPDTVDQTLINGFGMAWSPNGIPWVNSVGGHVSELYKADGGRVRPGVNIPGPTEATGGFPTGIVFSGGKGFKLPNGGQASFLFTGFDGVLSGWNGGDNAVRLRTPADAHYTGLAIATNNGHSLIYGANFGAKKIDVWDTLFNKVTMSFVDPQIPSRYSPYNIQAVGDVLFVIYGELGGNGLGVPGAGSGYVSVFNTDGTFIRRFASRGSLNLPWGVTMAPADFLKDDGRDISNENGHGNGGGTLRDPVVLVGNFGNGRINVYTVDGKYLGQLQSRRHTLVIEGLWALTFAPSTATTVDPNRLYFTAGPAQESDGVFGYIIKE